VVLDALLHAVDRIGAALVVSTHDPAVADRLALRWHMADGGLQDALTEAQAGGGRR
jgi:putative ABC transport system ATP-binding protein